MHPADCPDWDYKAHPSYLQDLPPRASNLLRDLRTHQVEVVDTREAHRRLFETVTPPEERYYAGHYRGENFRCLRYYNVIVGNQPGAPSATVPLSMGDLGTAITTALRVMDQASQLPNVILPAEEKLKYAVAVACGIFIEFLRIHPYADGNGHTARFLVCAMIGRYGYWPNQNSWPIDPRPPDPPYTQLILQYQAGNMNPLEMHLLSCYQ